MALWVVRWTPDRMVPDRVLAMALSLCSWARRFSLIVGILNLNT